MKKIKIIYIIYSLEFGGAQKVIASYVKNLSKQNYELSVCAIRQGGPMKKVLEGLGARVFILNKRIGFSIKIIFKLINLLKKGNFDIIHLHDHTANKWVVPVVLMLGIKRIVRTEHVILDKRRNEKVYPWIYMFLNLFNKKIIAVSEFVKNFHSEKDYLNKNKYVTIYNGIKCEEFTPTVDKTKLRRELGLEEARYVVGNIGRLHEAKGQRYLLEAANLILHDEPSTHFVIIGDGPLKSVLVNYSKELGISERVIFSGVREDIANMMNLIDIFVLPSLWEAHPITILEAMAAGKPVVATNVGGNEETIIDGITGFIVPPKDPESLANAILTLIRDVELSRQMGVKGREWVRKNFDECKMIEKTQKIYQSLLPGEKTVNI